MKKGWIIKFIIARILEKLGQDKEALECLD